MDLPLVRHYRLHDLGLRVRSDRPALLHALDAALRYKGAEEAPSAECHLTLDFAVDRARAARPEAARRRGRSARGGVTLWQDERRMYLSYGEALVTLDPEAGRAAASLPVERATFSDRRRDPLFYLVAFSLSILLRYRQWYPLHAAALVRAGRGLLLVAESDSGKSTAALNLVRQGWDYLSDDAVLLRAAATGVCAYAFRRPFCVDPEAVVHFPKLAGLSWPASLSDATKWQVDAGRVYPGQFAAMCTPRVLVLPEVVPAATSALEPVAAKTMLGHLINQSDLLATSNRAVVADHLDVFRRLIGQAALYRLAAGRDLLEDPTKTGRLLAPLLTGAP